MFFHLRFVLLVFLSLAFVILLNSQVKKHAHYKYDVHPSEEIAKLVTRFQSTQPPRPAPVRPANSSYPLILYWNHAFYDPASSVSESRRTHPCRMTFNRGRIREAKAVIFHYAVIHKADLPWRHYRHPGQVFIWWSAEPPSVIVAEGRDLEEFKNFFNWTWTYRRSSDVVRDYGNRRKALSAVKRGKKAVDDVIASKTHLAIWFASNCNHTLGARARFQFAMSIVHTGLPVSLQGACFGTRRSRSLAVNKRILEKEARKHKFFFAFESALHCKDYVTEKFWDNALLHGSVPVVWGPFKDDVLAVSPLNSFIFAEDFGSPVQLANYLKFLDKNDNEYRKYFRWREDENLSDEDMLRMTRERYPNLQVAGRLKSLCEKLLENSERKVIRSLADEIIKQEDKNCVGSSSTQHKASHFTSFADLLQLP